MSIDYSKTQMYFINACKSETPLKHVLMCYRCFYYHGDKYGIELKSTTIVFCDLLEKLNIKTEPQEFLAILEPENSYIQNLENYLILLINKIRFMPYSSIPSFEKLDLSILDNYV